MKMGYVNVQRKMKRIDKDKSPQPITKVKNHERKIICHLWDGHQVIIFESTLNAMKKLNANFYFQQQKRVQQNQVDNTLHSSKEKKMLFFSMSRKDSIQKE